MAPGRAGCPVPGPGLPYAAPEHERATRRLGPLVRPRSRASSVEGLSPQGRPFSLRYFLRTDSAFRVREVELALLGSDSRLVLRSDGAGLWSDEKGRPLPEFDGCIDVDLSISPFTHTLPIRRLGLAPDSSDDIVAVCLSAPSFSARPSRQRYVCLEPDHYLFERLDTGLRSELRVDSHGLVLDDPGLFRRLPSR